MKRLLSAALAVIAAAACSSTSLPDRGGDDPRLEFTSAADPRDYLFPTPRATVQHLAGGVSVSTMMTHPEGCRDFDAELNESGDRLEVSVAITPTRTLMVCRGGPANYTYTARLRDLARGDYTLVVRHVYPNGDRPNVVVLETEITVD
ncbi:MAG TPA: hypothetical protein VFR81_18345 [Longimicrobium sp.]|nr:hypothetical protein [Longimicrobium sp.]